MILWLGSYLCDGYPIVGSVEDGAVVVLVVDLDGQGANVLQLRPAVVRGLHGHVHELVAVRLVSVEDLKNKIKQNLNLFERKNFNYQLYIVFIQN